MDKQGGYNIKIFTGYLFLFSLMAASISPAHAAKKATCEIASINGNTVVLDCGAQAKKFNGVKTVTVRKTKKNDLLPGC